MDRDGNKKARDDIAAAKVKVPLTVKKVVDVAIQVHGAAGRPRTRCSTRRHGSSRSPTAQARGAPAFDRPAPHLVRKPRGFDDQRALETAVDEIDRVIARLSLAPAVSVAAF
jgi:hypothetical protein